MLLKAKSNLCAMHILRLFALCALLVQSAPPPVLGAWYHKINPFRNTTDGTPESLLEQSSSLNEPLNKQLAKVDLMLTVLEDVQRSKKQLAERSNVQDLLRQLHRLKSDLGGKKKSIHNDLKAFQQEEGDILLLQESLQDSLQMAKEAVNQSDRQIGLILKKSKVLSNGSKSAETQNN